MTNWYGGSPSLFNRRHEVREADSRSSGIRSFHTLPLSSISFREPLVLPSDVIHMRATCPVRFIPFMNSENYEVPRYKCLCISLTSEQDFQLPVREDLQCVFFMQCQRPSFTPVENNRKTFTLRVLITFLYTECSRKKGKYFGRSQYRSF